MKRKKETFPVQGNCFQCYAHLMVHLEICACVYLTTANLDLITKLWYMWVFKFALYLETR